MPHKHAGATRRAPRAPHCPTTHTACISFQKQHPQNSAGEPGSAHTTAINQAPCLSPCAVFPAHLLLLGPPAAIQLHGRLSTSPALPPIPSSIPPQWAPLSILQRQEPRDEDVGCF